ncbi:MAG: hypothetical protein JO047_06260, partial [Alphaproteobacteria bacterium]|nr:hypothetical protein [Alphaproteobacteria bacterium]
MNSAAVLTLASPQWRTRWLLSGLFFTSGFCSLLYQVVWLRMAFAQFGIITPVLSVVISVFMLGLGLGALLAGRCVGPLGRALGVSPAVLYGLAELLIGVGAVAVPPLLRAGGGLLLGVGASASWAYLALSAVAIAAALLPWCVMMGATFPLMLAFVRARWPDERGGFSFLYRANVAGAAIGTLASAMALIELLGFRATSLLGAALNIAIAAISVALGRQALPLRGAAPARARLAMRRAARWQELVLFTTGFCSLAMEVVWTRGFTIILQTTIYAFAAILATYLIATALGSALYRRALRAGRVPADGWLLLLAAASACLPAVIDDPRLQATAVGVLASIAPFCAVLGFLTPKLLDDYAEGDPALAGRGYAVNILGSIVGPLVAGYGLVVWFAPRVGLLVLALPLIALAGWAVLRRPAFAAGVARAALVVPLALLLVGLRWSRSYESVVYGLPHEVHRDYAATAIAFGTGRNKVLLVNGIGITVLTPITKVMAHLPLAVHGHARDGLVICFGMGTTFRSMLSWGIDATVVDLTRSVIDSFGFFHADARALVAEPNAHLVVDDGRRFLLREDRGYDVISIDPPPPVEAAGSSLLYSREFYRVLKRRLRPGGILQQWFPGGEPAIERGVVRSLLAEFPYVVAYRSVEGWGYHFLAAMQPIAQPTAAEFASRLPAGARRDVTEWGPAPTPETMGAVILAGRTDAAAAAG